MAIPQYPTGLGLPDGLVIDDVMQQEAPGRAQATAENGGGKTRKGEQRRGMGPA